MPEVLSNLATTTLSSALAPGGLSASVVTTAGFPSTGDFRIRIGNEIIVVTGSPSGGTLPNLLREQEGTTAPGAPGHAVGAPVRHVITRQSLLNLISEGAAGLNAALQTLGTMDEVTHAQTYANATTHGLALLLDADADDTKQALGLENVDNSADTSKPVSTLQQQAINRVPRRSNTTNAAFDISTLDIGSEVALGFNGAQTATLKPTASGGPTWNNTGEWFEITATHQTGTKTLAWASGVTMRNPATGTPVAGPSSVTISTYERFRVHYLGSDLYQIVGRAPGSASPDIAVLKEAPLNIKFAPTPASVASGNNAPAIQSALDTIPTEAGGGEVLIPPGEWFITESINISSQHTSLRILGDLVVPWDLGGNASSTLAVSNTVGSPGGAVPASGPISPTIPEMILLKKGGSQINNCRIVGPGRLRCNRRAINAITMDTGRYCHLENFEINDPIHCGIMVEDTTGPFPAGLDSDSNHFSHIFMRAHSTALPPSAFPEDVTPPLTNHAFYTDFRPRFMFVITATSSTPSGGSGRFVSDMTIENCICTNGLRPEQTDGGDDGGWFADLVDCQRIKIRDCMMSDNTRRYNGGVRIRQTAAANAGAGFTNHGHIIDRFYMESIPTSTTANWVCRAVYVWNQSGGATPRDLHWINVHDLRCNMVQTANGGRRLDVINASSAAEIYDVTFRSPRTNLAVAGQIQASGAGVVRNCYAEVAEAAEGARVIPWTSKHASNRIFKLTGTGAAGSGSGAPGFE